MEKEAGVVGLLMGFLGGASAAAYLVASAGQEVRGGRLKGQLTSFGMFFFQNFPLNLWMRFCGVMLGFWKL